MIKNKARITTNIDYQLLRFVDSLAKKREVTRREILEESLRKLFFEAQARVLTEEYNKMADDRELMNEWLEIANNPENLKW